MGQGKSQEKKRTERFDRYIEKLSQALGHRDRTGPCRDYCTGLLLPGDRKSVEPMAARISPKRVSNRHQSMNHLVSKAPWSDDAVMDVASFHALRAMTKEDEILSWIVDDTGIPKKGVYSVGVARQYCGRLGKQDNCQVAVSLSVASEWASMPVAYRLYLPEEWAKDAKRRKKAGVPKEVRFQKKWEIALDQIRKIKSDGEVDLAPVNADAGYGVAVEFRDGLTELDLQYMVGIQEHTSVWTEGSEPLFAPPYSGKGRPRKLLRRDEDHQPVSVKDVALSLSFRQYKQIRWREGAKGEMSSRFAAIRVRPSSRDWKRSELRPQEWLLIEWPEGEKEPTKYWFSTLTESSTLQDLVAQAKIRWRIERDYEELKGELGLDHFEGRSWRGFHHHATLCIAAYAFLVSERLFFSSRKAKAGPAIFTSPALSQDYRPRGSPAR